MLSSALMKATTAAERQRPGLRPRQVVRALSTASRPWRPSSVGMATKKENSVAARRLMPMSRPPMIVAAERLVPGNQRERLEQADLQRIAAA